MRRNLVYNVQCVSLRTRGAVQEDSMRTLTFSLATMLILVHSFAFAQWVQSNGPCGGGVTCFDVNGTDLFVATSDHHGVFLSRNNGTTWEAISTGLPYQSYHIFALAAIGTTVFAGTFGDGVYRSTDYGLSWTAASAGLWNYNVRALSVIGTNIFAGTDYGIFRSTDNGTSWSGAGLGSYQVESFASSGANMFAGTFHGVCRSTDGGTSWTSVSTGLTSLSFGALLVSGTNLFAGAGTGEVYLSTDNGTSWRSVNLRPRTVEQVVALVATGMNVFAGTAGGGVFLSTDNGASWQAVNAGLANRDVTDLAILGPNLFASTAVGVFRSTDNGISWSSVNTGLMRPPVAAIARSGANLFAGTLGGGVFVSSDNGDSWIPVNKGLNDNCNVSSLAVTGTSLLAGTLEGAVFHSEDNGSNWSTSNTALGAGKVRSLAVSGLNLFAGTDNGAFLSTDNSNTWTPVKRGLNFVPHFDQPCGIFALAVSGTKIFAGSGWGNVYLTTNNGALWTCVPTGAGWAFNNVISLASSGMNVFAGTVFRGVFHSTNDGANWTAINTGLTDTAEGCCLAICGANLFAGTRRGGVFLSTDNGASWSAANTGIPPVRVLALFVNGEYLLAGTDGAGVLRRRLSEMIMSIDARTGELPSEFHLRQNYPNPFNPSTTIKFELPKSSQVRLIVFDLFGREVSVLVNERKESGYHEIKFDGSNLATGVYFYRLQAGDLAQTKKLLLVK